MFIEIVGHYRFHLTLLGFNLERSIYVVKGLVKSSAILGFDFIRETQLVVSGQNIFFRDLKKEDCAALSVLHAPGRISVPAHSMLTVKLNVKDLKGKPLPVGLAGVNSAALEGLGVWNTLDQSNWYGQVSAVIVNTADADRCFQNNEILGLFDPVKEESL